MMFTVGDEIVQESLGGRRGVVIDEEGMAPDGVIAAVPGDDPVGVGYGWQEITVQWHDDGSIAKFTPNEATRLWKQEEAN